MQEGAKPRCSIGGEHIVGLVVAVNSGAQPCRETPAALRLPTRRHPARREQPLLATRGVCARIGAHIHAVSARLVGQRYDVLNRIAPSNNQTPATTAQGRIEVAQAVEQETDAIGRAA